jgi:hypothetical protein
MPARFEAHGVHGAIHFRCAQDLRHLLGQRVHDESRKARKSHQAQFSLVS